MSSSRTPYGGGGMAFSVPPFTPMVKRILIVLAAVFGFQVLLFLVSREGYALLLGLFGLDPQLRLRLLGGAPSPPLALWQLGSYGLLHSLSPTHLLMNGLGIWMFGGQVERVLGSRGMLRYFVLCVVGGGLAVVAAGALTGAFVPVIGASGGVLGLVVAFARMFPHERVFIFPLPFPIPAWVMGAIYAGLNLYGAIMPGQSGVSYAAHIGGLLAGLAYIHLLVKPGVWLTWRASRRRPKLRVVERRPPGPYDIH